MSHPTHKGHSNKPNKGQPKKKTAPKRKACRPGAGSPFPPPIYRDGKKK